MFQTKFVTAVALVGIGVLLILYVMVPSSRTTDHHYHSSPLNSIKSYYLSKPLSGFTDEEKLALAEARKQEAESGQAVDCSFPYNE